ncbi:MAG: hypothetical protein NT138_20655 [Planctomycetales bacterium]|nr:hypothetical protein [Planctomycetales bacterium]
MERYRGQLLATASRKMIDLLKRSVEPDDVVQEAISYCLKTFSEIDSKALDPMPWVHQVLERRIVDVHCPYSLRQPDICSQSSRRTIDDRDVATDTGPAGHPPHALCGKSAVQRNRRQAR